MKKHRRLRKKFLKMVRKTHKIKVCRVLKEELKKIKIKNVLRNEYIRILDRIEAEKQILLPLNGRPIPFSSWVSVRGVYNKRKNRR